MGRRKTVIKYKGVFAGRPKVWVGNSGNRSKVAQEITDELMSVAMEQPVANTMAEVYRTAKKIREVVKIEIRQMSKIIDELLNSDQLSAPHRLDTMEGPSQFSLTAQMLQSKLSNREGKGASGPSSLQNYGGTSKPATGEVRWSYLSRGWLNEKKPHKNFFHGKTGRLRRALSDLNSWAQKDLGGVEVTVRRGKGFMEDTPERAKLNKKFRMTQGRSFLLAQLDIRIFGKIGAGQAPGLASQDWTKAGKSEKLPGSKLDKVRDKLDGPKHRFTDHGRRRASTDGAGFYRPLLTPVAQFWALHRLPQAIRWAAEQPLTRQRAALKGNLATLKSGRT